MTLVEIKKFDLLANSMAIAEGAKKAHDTVTQTRPKFTSSDITGNQKPLDLIQTVKKSAMYHWENLLPACGIDIPAKGKHSACPVCGGTNRFHFIDDHHHGNWHCRQCDYRGNALAR